jgi:hypothetical protein
MFWTAGLLINLSCLLGLAATTGLVVTTGFGDMSGGETSRLERRGESLYLELRAGGEAARRILGGGDSVLAFGGCVEALFDLPCRGGLRRRGASSSRSNV